MCIQGSFTVAVITAAVTTVAVTTVAVTTVAVTTVAVATRDMYPNRMKDNIAPLILLELMCA